MGIGKGSGGGGVDLSGVTYLHPGTRYGEPRVERLDVAQLKFVGCGWTVRYYPELKMKACNKRLPDEARALYIEPKLSVLYSHTLQTQIYLQYPMSVFGQCKLYISFFISYHGKVDVTGIGQNYLKRIY